MKTDVAAIPTHRFIVKGKWMNGDSRDGFLHFPSGFYFEESGKATVFESKQNAEFAINAMQGNEYTHKILIIKNTIHELVEGDSDEC